MLSDHNSRTILALREAMEPTITAVRTSTQTAREYVVEALIISPTPRTRTSE